MIVKTRNPVNIFTAFLHIQSSNPISRPLPSKHPITSQLQRCRALNDLKSVHAAMIKNNAHHDSFFMNQFVTACSRLGRMDYALQAFDQMPDPNVFVYNAVIAGFVCCSELLRAIEFYIEMFKSCILPTSYTFSSLIKACVQSSAFGFGEAVHGQVLKMGFESHLFVQTGLIDFYSSLGRIVESRRVFDEMPGRDAFAFTMMISGHTRIGDLDSARRLFEEMPERSTVSWNTMIAGYARLGDVDRASSLFNQMPVKDLISWTTMISCYSQNNRFREAVETFEGMRAAEVTPDEVTMATIISACAHLGALGLGRELHHYVMLNGFPLDVYIGSALVDMYAKCGSIERSLVVFFKLKEKNLFCWNSVIEGLASHGHGKSAVDMFHTMEKQGVIEPNVVSFVSVLSACTHAGLVDEGRRLFSSMAKDYSITPEVEHYGCMVDLLGRAGFLQEALEFIQSMEMEPNAVVWGALLGGCKIHHNLKIGEFAVQKLVELEPDNSGYYMLLINMHAEESRWGEAASVRGIMKRMGVEKKSPGCSWIEMEGMVHEFAASDVSHCDSDEICSLLVAMDGQMKLAECIDDMYYWRMSNQAAFTGYEVNSKGFNPQQ